MKEGLIKAVASDANSNTLIALSKDPRFSYCNSGQFLYARNNLAPRWSDTFRLPLDIQSIWDVEIDPFNPSHLYLVSESGYSRVHVSFDAGKSWTESEFDRDSLYIFSLTQDERQPNVVYASGYGPFFKSVDGGRTFQTIRFEYNLRVRRFGRVVIDKNDSNVLYFLFNQQGILKSTDGGITVTSVAGTPPKGGWSMVQLPGQNSFLLLGKGGTIHRTTNGGLSWKQVSKLEGRGFFYTLSAELVAADKKGQHFFVTTNDRYLYESLDGGKNWKDITEEFGPGTQVFEMTDPRNGTFFVATSRGVYQNVH